MKVLIDGRTLKEKTSSISVYLHNLLYELNNNRNLKLLIVVNKRFMLKGFNNTRNAKIILVKVRNNIIWDNIVIPFQAIKNKADIILYPKSSSCYFKIPNIKIITTIHGMIYKKLPQSNPFYTNIYWRGVGKIASKVSNRVIAVSNNDKQDLISEGCNPKKMEIIPIGYNKVFSEVFPIRVIETILGKYNLKKRGYIIQIGNIIPKKNQKFSLEQIKNNKLKIVFIGKTNLNKEYYQDIRKIPNIELIKRIVFTGPIDQNNPEFSILLQNAFCSFFPSLYEGFGMPTIESIAAGTPVLASDRGALPEILGRDNVLPLNEEAWKKELEKMIKNKKYYNAKIKKQKEIIKKYDWKNIGKEYIKLFEDVLKE